MTRQVRTKLYSFVTWRLRIAKPLAIRVIVMGILTFAFSAGTEAAGSLPVKSISFKGVAQTPITIRGTVNSVTCESMPGVNVIVKGTTNGTTTDADGKHSLTVSEPGHKYF